MHFSACIFDLDGTLLDTIGDISQAMNDALRFFAYPEHTVSEYKILVGEGLDKLIAYALPRNRSDAETVKRVKEVMKREYLEHLTDTTVPYAGIPELLDSLSGRGIKLAILSNKPHDMAVLSTERLLSSWPFKAVMGIRPEMPPKPDPAAALAIAGILGEKPARVLFVGDSEIDIQTAHNAGMQVAAVTWGFRQRAELEKCNAEFIIDRPAELLQLL